MRPFARTCNPALDVNQPSSCQVLPTVKPIARLTRRHAGPLRSAGHRFGKSVWWDSGSQVRHRGRDLTVDTALTAEHPQLFAQQRGGRRMGGQRIPGAATVRI